MLYAADGRWGMLLLGLLRVIRDIYYMKSVASYALDEEDVGELSATYDLGGGASAFAVMKAGAANDGTEDFSAVGINFAF